MRLWHQSFTVLQDLPAYVDVLKERIAEVVRPDTEVVLHGQIPGTYTSEYPGTDLAYGVLYWMHGLQWLAAAREAEKQGFDAMVLASIAGPMAQEIRTIVDIPVIGYGEAAFNLAGVYGRRAGMLFFIKERLDFWPQQLKSWGLQDRFAGIEHAGVTFHDVLGAHMDAAKRDAVVSRIVEQGEKLVRETGADVASADFFERRREQRVGHHVEFQFGDHAEQPVTAHGVAEQIGILGARTGDLGSVRKDHRQGLDRRAAAAERHGPPVGVDRERAGNAEVVVGLQDGR